MVLPAAPGQRDRGASWRVTDALSGEIIGHGTSIRLNLKRGDTRVLHYE